MSSASASPACRSVRSKSAPPPRTPNSTILGLPLRSTLTRGRSTASCLSTSCRACCRAEEWRHIESGIIQRITAINLLLDDIYHDQHVLRDGVVPAELILGNHNYRPLMRGIDLPHKAYVNICGTDIVRDERGTFLVLEDNARTPSGVSYVVENRHMMLRAFPDLLDDIRLACDRQLRCQADRCIAGGGARWGCRSAGRSAFPRHLQLGLFRACLPSARDGRAAGRRTGSRGRERSRLTCGLPAGCRGST